MSSLFNKEIETVSYDRTVPCTQFWVNMLPLAFTKTDQGVSDLESTISARFTLEANELLIEYPNKQINRSLRFFLFRN